MKNKYKYCCVVDAQGYYDLESNPYVKVISEKGDFSDAEIDGYAMENGEYLVDALPPYGMVTPRWDGVFWEETATPEEIEAVEADKILDEG